MTRSGAVRSCGPRAAAAAATAAAATAAPTLSLLTFRAAGVSLSLLPTLHFFVLAYRWCCCLEYMRGRTTKRCGRPHAQNRVSSWFTTAATACPAAAAAAAAAAAGCCCCRRGGPFFSAHRRKSRWCSSWCWSVPSRCLVSSPALLRLSRSLLAVLCC